MFNDLYIGKTIYEIVYYDLKSEPTIYEYTIDTMELITGGLLLPNKYIGARTITESMIGSSIFLSYNDAKNRLDYLIGGKRYA